MSWTNTFMCTTGAYKASELSDTFYADLCRARPLHVATAFLAKILKKQYITVDNSSKLLYTVYNEGGTK